MKTKLTMILVLAFVVTNISCKKTIENNGLAGKWQLVEVYNGYANGGNFQWNAVPAEYSHLLSFTADGKYFKTETNGSDTIACSGTYTFKNGDTIEVVSDCNTVTVKEIISELNPQTLVLDHQVIEGVIRDKYKAVK